VALDLVVWRLGTLEGSRHNLFGVENSRRSKARVNLNRWSERDTWREDLTSASSEFGSCKGLYCKDTRSPEPQNRSEPSTH
jgi:hypothetical protein